MSSSIWVESDGAWKLLAPVGFPDEATLHRLVEEAPQLLPLSGSPRLVVLGREVPLGGGFADLLAVEPSGRLVVLEVKLARNAEARRAVVAQILAYAAYMRGTPLRRSSGRSCAASSATAASRRSPLSSKARTRSETSMRPAS